MNLLHTLEEIRYFTNLKDQSNKLLELSKEYNNQELLELSEKYENIIQEELNKYNSYVGMICLAPPAFLSDSKEYRKGKIEGNFYFNYYSKSVRCNFRYSSGGFDTHAISELNPIQSADN